MVKLGRSQFGGSKPHTGPMQANQVYMMRLKFITPFANDEGEVCHKAVDLVNSICGERKSLFAEAQRRDLTLQFATGDVAPSGTIEELANMVGEATGYQMDPRSLDLSHVRAATLASVLVGLGALAIGGFAVTRALSRRTA